MARGPSDPVYPNFRILMVWNRLTYFAPLRRACCRI